MVKVIICSHKRAGRVTTHNRVANTLLCIPESQYDEYAKFHPAKTIITHPDTVVGLPAKRQWIYETHGSVMMLDDDSNGMVRLWPPRFSMKPKRMSPLDAYHVIQATADNAKQAGCYLFGFAQQPNPIVFGENKPLRLGGYSPGGAIGIHEGSKLFWPTDTTLPIDDYWICLLNAYYHRKAWYDQRFSLGFMDTYIGAGGMSEYRRNDAEVTATEYLKKHFGKAIVPKRVGAKLRTQRKSEAVKGARSMEIPWSY